MERKRTTPKLITSKKRELHDSQQPDVEPDVQRILQEMRVPDLIERIPPKRQPDLTVRFGRVDCAIYHPDWMLTPGKYKRFPLKHLRPGRYLELEEHFTRMSEDQGPWQKTSALLKRAGRRVLVQWPTASRPSEQ